MESSEDLAAIDYQVRHFIYDQLMTVCAAPSLAETAAALGHDPALVAAAFQRLAAGRVVVLQEDGELLMANPFAAVPTPFVVVQAQRSWWANCIWDALGIAALLQGNARILTSCGDCGHAMQVTLEAGRLAAPEGLLHFALPARRWWDNIVFN